MGIVFRKLRADEIDCRVATVSEKGCSLLLYKDARVDQNMLDEAVGCLNWQRSHQIIEGNLYCTVSIWDDAKGQWVSKQDVGTESYTEKEKGQASDSFKRACFNWGIGRELYTAPFIWIPAGKVNLVERGGKYTTYDRFRVKAIGYDADGNINRLTIVSDKTGGVVYTMGVSDTPEEKTVDQGKNKLTPTDIKAVRMMLERMGKTEAGICEYFGLAKLEDMTTENMVTLNKLIEDAKKKRGKKDE